MQVGPVLHFPKSLPFRKTLLFLPDAGNWLDTRTVDLPKQWVPYQTYTGDRGKGTSFLVFYK